MGASSSSQYKKDPEIRLSDAVRRGIVAAASVEGLLPATLTHTSLVFVPRVALHPSYPAITEINLHVNVQGDMNDSFVLPFMALHERVAGGTAKNEDLDSALKRSANSVSFNEKELYEWLASKLKPFFAIIREICVRKATLADFKAKELFTEIDEELELASNAYLQVLVLNVPHDNPAKYEVEIVHVKSGWKGIVDNEVLRSRLGEPNSAPLDIGRLKVNAAKFAAEIDDMLGDIHTGLAKFQE